MITTAWACINISMVMTFCDMSFIMVSFYDYFFWNKFSASLHYWCMCGNILLMNFRWLKFVFVKSYQVLAVWREQSYNYSEVWCRIKFCLIKPPNIYRYKDGKFFDFVDFFKNLLWKFSEIAEVIYEYIIYIHIYTYPISVCMHP